MSAAAVRQVPVRSHGTQPNFPSVDICKAPLKQLIFLV